MSQNPPTVIQTSTTLHILLFFLTIAFLLIRSIDSIWGGGVDLAHHYALVARLTEFWNIPYLGDPSLGEMNYYPRASHVLAAVVGRLLGSALLGMQVITLLSIILIWSSLVYIVLSLPKNTHLIAAFFLSAILWANHRYFHIELHADEVSENFFYAQLVAQAFVIFSVALMLYCDRRGIRPELRHIFLAVAVYIATGIHLLPALELLFFFIALAAIDLYRQAIPGKFSVRAGSFTVFLILAAIAALALHPSISTMRSLSKNNGDIFIHYIQSMRAISVYCALHVVSSIIILRFWFLLGQGKRSRQLIALKYIGVYGLSVSGLCLLQIIALRLGHGSEYAVKKYLFALNTALLIELSMFISLAKFKFGFIIARSGNFYTASAYLLAPLLIVSAFLCVTPVAASLDTSDLVALEHRLLLRRDLSIPSTPGKFDYVYGIDGLPSQVAYMMSIGVLKAPRAQDVVPNFALPGWWINDWNRIGTIVTSEYSNLDQDPACRRAAPVQSLVMLDGACLAKWYGSPRVIGFSSKDGLGICRTVGLSSPENFGTWTDRSAASLSCPVPIISGKAPTELQIDSWGFLDHVAVQRVLVGVEGAPAVEYRFDVGHPMHLISLALPKNLGKEVQVNFILPDAISPKQLGLSQDARQLGISIKRIEFK